METAQDAPLNLMGVVNICGSVLWVWPWYLVAIRKSWSLCIQCILNHLQHNIIECMRGVYVLIKHSSYVM